MNVIFTFEAANLLEKHKHTTFLYSVLLTTFASRIRNHCLSDKLAQSFIKTMSKETFFNILPFERLASTNNKLKSLKLTDSLDEFTVVLTDDQTAGKGQAGNSWESEPNKNLTFSLLLNPTYIEIQDQFIISKAVALGILQFLKYYSPDFSIKWPNDIYYKNNKIGGILIENSICQNLISDSIIGIGLNINQTDFMSNAPNPISLKNITGNEFDLETTLHKILESIANCINQIKLGNIESLNELYLKNLYRKDGSYLYKDKEGAFYASINAINQYGHLELKTTEDEKKCYAFKEVEFVINKEDN